MMRALLFGVLGIFPSARASMSGPVYGQLACSFASSSGVKMASKDAMVAMYCLAADVKMDSMVVLMAAV